MSIARLLTSKTRPLLRAMDLVQANIMVADADLNIIYMNRSVTDLLKEAEPELRRELPQFSVEGLKGRNIDAFHKDKRHQRAILSTLAERHSATIRIGSRQFDLLVTPVMDGQTRIGFVVEWSNAQVRLQNVDYAAQIAAISRSQAVIEFAPTGEIIWANDNFLTLLGYRLEEIRGRHHSMFVEADVAAGEPYAQFWAALRDGRYQAAEFRRVTKSGSTVYIQASYNPILDEKGQVVKVVKYAVDVTQRVETVAALGGALDRLCAGDFAFQLSEPFAPEFEQMRSNLNRSVAQLNETFRAIAAGVATMDNGTQEISRGVNDLSKRTETQAASLEETAAALDQITVNVTAASQRAEDAMKVAREANTSAEHSAEVMAEAVAAMGGIEKSSGEISSIIGVIDEIAFQTNLLALNAGVEAARAGEAGKGFAVVAQEVRELAQRSAAAAKEIKTLIRNSSAEVANGVRLVSNTGQSLQTIGALIVEINRHMEAISASAREQTAGLTEINTAVNALDQTTQQNAAMVEESSAAASTMAHESHRLGTMVARFTLGGDPPSAGTALRGRAEEMRRTMAPPARRAAPARGTLATAEWTEF